MVKRGQAGIEYMILIGFVTFAILVILVISFSYSGLIKDRIKTNQIESFAIELIGNAESVFFAGEPSVSTIQLYLPENIQDITINTNDIIITYSSSSGPNIRAFKSNVPLQGSINTGEGIKTIVLRAEDNYVDISN